MESIIRVYRSLQQQQAEATMVWKQSAEKLDIAGRGPDWSTAIAALSPILLPLEVSQHLRYSAYNAALALLARDLISPQAFQLLYAPWAAGADAHLEAVA